MCQGHHTEVCGHTVFRPFEVTKMESDDEMITVDCSSNSSDSGVNSGPGKFSKAFMILKLFYFQLKTSYQPNLVKLILPTFCGARFWLE